MQFSQLIEFIGHFMGAVLQLVLIMMMARRKDKRHSEKVFFTLVVAIFIWHAGNFISTFSELLVGQRVIVIGLTWDMAATLSMGIVPALLIHAFLAFLDEAPDNFFSQYRRFFLFGAYAPLALFWPGLIRLFQHPELPRSENLLIVTEMFLYWTIIALAVSLFMCYMLWRLTTDDVQRRFYMSLVRMFVVIFGLLILTHIFYAKYLPGLGKYFLVSCRLAPMFPTIIFSYFILRYNYMEYVLKRSIFHAILATFVLGVYILGIRQAGDFLEKTLNIDFRIVEAILVIGLILLIEPLREWFQTVFNSLFFREQIYYRRVFTELSHRMGSMQGVEVGRLLRYVANSVQAAMRLNNCRIALFRAEGDDLVVDESSAPMQSDDIATIIRQFRDVRAHSISLWQTDNQLIVKELKSLDATLILPIYRDGSLAGIMSLGPSTQYRELYESEIEMLSILLNHLVTAVDNTRLMEDKLKMERRMLASEKWMSIGRLSGQIAHEVKNPLSSIKAITHVMREETPPDNRFYSDLEMVEGEIDRLAGVVNQLLQVARPMGQEEKSANVCDIVESVASVLRAEASQNDIAIECDQKNDIPIMKASPVALRDIIFNLMNNAVQSMTSGGTLSVSITCPAPDGEAGRPSILLTVHDTGPGIPEEELPKIFEPFHTTKEGGTGLGLWIVREKLADLGGTITVESNEGTTVSIIVPIETPAVDSPRDSDPSSNPEKSDV